MNLREELYDVKQISNEIVKEFLKENFEETEASNLNEKFFEVEFDLDKDPKVGDVLYVNEKLLDSSSYLFSFGPLVSKFGKNMTSTKDPDLIVLAMGDEKKYLKRYYG